MGLKLFHVLFMMIAFTFSGGFGVWAFRTGSASGSPLEIAIGVFFLVLAFATPFYTGWFVRKMKDVDFF